MLESPPGPARCQGVNRHVGVPGGQIEALLLCGPPGAGLSRWTVRGQGALPGSHPAQLRPSVCRRLAKSTLLLIPLFGIHYMVFAVLPTGTSSRFQLLFELCAGSFQVRAGGRAAPSVLQPPPWRH